MPMRDLDAQLVGGPLDGQNVALPPFPAATLHFAAMSGDHAYVNVYEWETGHFYTYAGTLPCSCGWDPDGD